MSDEITIFTDGGSRGNPGISACAFVAKRGEEIVFSKGFFLGTKTNNEAEYQGLIESLLWLKNKEKDFNNISIKLFMDSELIVKQINGIYKIKSTSLKKYFDKAEELIKEVDLQIDIMHVKRNDNKTADFLVNKTLDENKISRPGRYSL